MMEVNGKAHAMDAKSISLWNKHLFIYVQGIIGGE